MVQFSVVLVCKNALIGYGHTQMKRALGGPDEGRSSRVNDVAFGAGGASVYACTEDCQVCSLIVAH